MPGRANDDEVRINIALFKGIQMIALIFKTYKLDGGEALPVQCRFWKGIDAVDPAVLDGSLTHDLLEALRNQGFDVDNREAVCANTLLSEWRGHPKGALVVAMSMNLTVGEMIAVSDT